MNQTFNTIRSSLSTSRSSNKSFRVVVKSRLTHEILPLTQEKTNRSKFNPPKQIDDQFVQQAKNNLKKYIKNMKTSSAKGAYNQSKKSIDKSQEIQKRNSLVNKNQIPQSIYEKQQLCNRSSYSTYRRADKSEKKFISSNLSEIYCQKNQNNKQTSKHFCSLTNNNLSNSGTPYKQEINQNQELINRAFQNQHHEPSNNESINQRNRLEELQNKVQKIISQKFKFLSNEIALKKFSQNSNSSYKLLQKQIDKILSQIRLIKLKESGKEISFHEQEAEINKNIQIIEKKVNIIERLIAEKLFEADNLRNVYLQKLKKHKSKIANVRSKSNSFYRQANNNCLSPLNFKDQKPYRQRINTLTTSKQSYQSPMKSYYINRHKQQFFNNGKLSQPLPRSSYNCEYFGYGALPSILNCGYDKINDHSLFNTIESQTHKNILARSLYKQDYSQKRDKEPINYKELDCYQDKFKTIKVNYGKEKDNTKIVNIQRNQKQIRHYTNDNQNNNPQDLSRKKFKSIHVLKQKTDQEFQPQTEQKIANYEQQSIQKMNLYNQRIKAEIKNKNLNRMKYEFNHKLIKSRQQKLKMTQ